MENKRLGLIIITPSNHEVDFWPSQESLQYFSNIEMFQTVSKAVWHCKWNFRLERCPSQFMASCPNDAILWNMTQTTKVIVAQHYELDQSDLCPLCVQVRVLWTKLFSRFITHVLVKSLWEQLFFCPMCRWGD